MQLLELLEVLGLDVAAWLSLHPAALAHIWDLGGERQVPDLLWLFIYSN